MRRFLSTMTVATVTIALVSCAQEAPEASGLPSSSVPGSSMSSVPGSSDVGSSELGFSVPGSSTPDAGLVHEQFDVTELGTFNEGWAMEFLPGTDLLAVTERGGTLKLRDQETGVVREVAGVPEVFHSGQAGLHDIIPGPTFEQDGTVYLSWARPHDAGAQGVVATAHLDTGTSTLRDVNVIWEQTPAAGDGHFSLRMLIQDGHLFVTSGDRQLHTPAQDTETNLGKVLRLNLDGTPAEGNPFADEGGVAAEFWTVGHRNPLGIDTDAEGRIWVSEMGPQGGDELNLLEEGENYGWPEASMGVEYGGSSIADHTGDDGFVGPVEYWDPSISPGSLAIYDGELFDGWAGSALLGALSGQALVRVQLDGTEAGEQQRFDAGARIREVEVADDGAIWILEDNDGRLLELRPQ